MVSMDIWAVKINKSIEDIGETLVAIMKSQALIKKRHDAQIRLLDERIHALENKVS